MTVPEKFKPSDKPRMDIHAHRGTKVVFAYHDAGYEADQRLAAKHLKAGQTYTVNRTVVDAWHTEVFLMEVPYVPFNSVMFAPAKEAAKENEAL